MKLTQSAVERFKMPAGKADHIEWDEQMPGFGLRCRKNGEAVHRSFVVQYKIGTKNRRMSLGNVGKVNVETARNKAKQIFGKLIDGADPANDRAQAKKDAGNTFGTMTTAFLDVQKRRLSAAWYEATERYINEHWKPLHGLAVASINRAVVAAELRKIEKERGKVASDRARAVLSKFFAWAIGEGLAESNPVIGTNKAVPEYEGRDRVLTDAELVAIWNSAPESDYGRIVKLLMLTGQRRDEIGSLRWSEIDSQEATGESQIALPADRTKNGRDHVVPLSGAALGLLRGCLRREGRDLVFGEGEGGFSGWSKAKLALDNASGVTEWTLHDLRRTAATRMSECGVLPHVVEAVLNHVSGHKAGVAGVYNRATYAAEKRDALERLASHIQTALAKAEGANVTALKRA
jgi:integrase